MALPRWKVLELAAFFVERTLRVPGCNVSVEYDVELPDKLTGESRWFEILVRSTDGRREFLRAVEVQHRKKTVAAPQVGEWADKAKQTGVHRVSAVSQVGFTKPALARIEKEPQLIRRGAAPRGQVPRTA